MLKGTTFWPTMEAEGGGTGGGGLGGEVELIGKVDGMIVIRSTRATDRKLAEIAVGPAALTGRVDLASLPDATMPEHQANIRASSSGCTALRAVASPVTVHLADKTVSLDTGSPVEISPRQTGAPEWAVAVVTRAGEFFVPKSSLFDGPPTVRMDRPRERLAQGLSQKTESQYLQFGKPIHFSDKRKGDAVFMPEARVLSEGPVQTGSEHGGVPGVNIRDKDSGFSAIVPVTFFAYDEKKGRQFTAPVSTAPAGTGMER